MEQQTKVGKYLFLAEPFHCDFSNHLFMGHLGNHLLNAADFHANDRDFGMHYLNTIYKTWVLSRLSIEMHEMPSAYARFYVETWVENVMRFFTHRNFKMTDSETGRVYGYGRSVWAMIDIRTRQPADILAVKNGAIATYIDTQMSCPIDTPLRVKTGKDMLLQRTIDTYYSDVDVNGHINSVKYIEHALNLWDAHWYQTHRIHRIDVAYVAESHWGDRLHLYLEQVSEEEYNICILKQSVDEELPVETCRIKIRFVNN